MFICLFFKKYLTLPLDYKLQEVMDLSIVFTWFLEQ